MPVTEGKETCFYIYITFTFIYLADTFIQRDLQLLYTLCQRSHASGATRGKVSCSHSFTNLTNHIDRMWHVKSWVNQWSYFCVCLYPI